jgi:hypothetical protein
VCWFGVHAEIYTANQHGIELGLGLGSPSSPPASAPLRRAAPLPSPPPRRPSPLAAAAPCASARTGGRAPVQPGGRALVLWAARPCASRAPGQPVAAGLDRAAQPLLVSLAASGPRRRQVLDEEPCCPASVLLPKKTAKPRRPLRQPVVRCRGASGGEGVLLPGRRGRAAGVQEDELLRDLSAGCCF